MASKLEQTRPTNNFHGFFDALCSYEIDCLKGEILAQVAPFFRGWNYNQIERVSSGIQTQEKALEVLAQLKEHTFLQVLSISWVKPILQCVLKREKELKDVTIYSNELEFDNHTGLSTGVIVGELHTAKDKLRYFKQIRQTQSATPCIFVGDSLTDLLTMMEADVGILIGNSDNIRDVCDSFGITILPLPLVKEEVHKLISTVHKSTIYRAQTWLEIKQFILLYLEI